MGGDRESASARALLKMRTHTGVCARARVCVWVRARAGGWVICVALGSGEVRAKFAAFSWRIFRVLDLDAPSV